MYFIAEQMQAWLGKTARPESPQKQKHRPSLQKPWPVPCHHCSEVTRARCGGAQREGGRGSGISGFKASLVYNPLTPGSRTVRALSHRETLSQKEKKVTVVQDWRIMTTWIYRQSGTLIKTSSLAVPMTVYLWPPKAGLQASSRNFAELT